MVLPSSEILSVKGVENKGSVSVKTKAIRNTLWKKAKKLSRKRRKAKRKRERKYRERKQMASLGKGQFDYYWGNYFRCVKWVQNHHASYWKSRAQALEYENRMLRAFVEQNPGPLTDYSEASEHSQTCTSRVNVNYMEDVAKWYTNCGIQFEGGAVPHDFDTDNSENVYTNKEGNTSVGNSDDEEFEFEVDDNMIEFFTQSMKHKLALQRERDNDSNSKGTNRSGTYRPHKKSGNVKKNRNTEEDESTYDACMFGLKKLLPTECFEKCGTVEGKDLQDILLLKAQREEKEKLRCDLFGRSSSKILGMETAVQLSFKQTCATKRPVMWPIIPLNL